MKRLLGILLLITAFLFPAFSQTVDPQAAREELENRGLEEEEVKRRMLEKGVDIDNIDPTDPAEVLKAEQVLEEVIQEIEAEKNETLGEVVSESVEEIKDAVEDGKALDEAIAEEIIDTQNENVETPPAQIYGQKIFRDKTIQVFSSAEDVRPPDSYVMGPGDQVNISIWGASQEDATYEINKEGFIKPARMPRISLKGKTFKSAKDLLASRFAQSYNFRREEFAVTITYSRTITINILGEVLNPGSFTLPATNTAFNALVAAGGPSNIGSVRNIRLIRGGASTRQIDVYEFMNDPAVREQFYLQDNDIIHVGTIGRTVKISGAVRRPLSFEMTNGEQLKKLVDYAGGLAANAYKGNIQVKRFVNDEEKIIDVDFRNLVASGGDFDLQSGDEVFVQTIPKPYKNFVEIGGAVELPGKFELRSGMKISDLVNKGRLLEGARQDIAFLLHTKSDGTTGYEQINLEEVIANPNSTNNLFLRPKDRLRVLSQTVYVDQATISIEGAVRNPGEQDLDSETDLKLNEAIILSGGLRRDATDVGYIFRVDPSNRKEKQYIRVNLRKALENPQSAENLTLQPSDQIEVMSQFKFIDQSFVSVNGAIRTPGEYRFDESLRLSDILTLAGGLQLQASTNRIDIFRVLITDNEPTKTVVATVEVDRDLNRIGGDDFILQPFDQIIVREAPEFELQRNISLSGEVVYPGTYALLDKNEQIWSVIKRAGGLTKEAFLAGATLFRTKSDAGYVLLNLDEVEKNAGSRYNFILKAGDAIVIPKKKDLVTIQLEATKASELYPNKLLDEGKLNVAYHENKNAKWYVKEYAAGVGEKGRNSLIVVEHPNGQIEQTKGFIFKKYPKVEKGSIITVGKKLEKPEKESEEKEEIDWGRVLADSITQATAILTLILLIQRLD